MAGTVDITEAEAALLFGGSHLQETFARGLVGLPQEYLEDYVDDFIAMSSKLGPGLDVCPWAFASGPGDLPIMFDSPQDTATRTFRREILDRFGPSEESTPFRLGDRQACVRASQREAS